MDRIDAEANKILKRELQERWDEETYVEIRREPSQYGFMGVYLWKTANLLEFSCSAEIPTMLKLAEFDLQKGTTITELVYSCCQRFPKKEAIESLIRLGKQKESEEKVVERVFEFQNGVLRIERTFFSQHPM